MYDNKNACLYFIYLILREYSDSEHFLTWNDIVEFMDSEYGVKVDRKLVGRNLALLDELGVDINKGNNGKGVALIERQLDHSEIELILTVLDSHPYINKTTLKNIAKDLMKDQSTYDRKKLRKEFRIDNLTQYHNKQSTYTLSAFFEAKKNNLRLEFLTINNTNEIKKNSLIPFNRIYNDNQLFLTFKANENDTDLFAFRVDEIMNCAISQKSIYEKLDIEEVIRMVTTNQFNQMKVNFYDSHYVYIDLLFNDRETLEDFIKQFNTPLKAIKEENRRITLLIEETSFLAWFCDNYRSVKILSPLSLYERFKETYLKA